jgi:ribosomal protein S18 acetylase RimI-like enzyme
MTESLVSFRPAEAVDFSALAEMYERLNTYYYQVGYRLPRPDNVGQAWLESFQRTLGRFSMVYVAGMGNDLVGFILCRVKRLPQHMGGVMAGEISDIWVEPGYRRERLGEQLVRLGLDWLRQQGVHSVEIQVLRDNENAWRFFQELGFELEFQAARLILEPS